MKLSVHAQNVLSHSGLEVIASLNGDSHRGTFILSDLSDYPAVRRTLRTAGLNVRRLGAATVEVISPSYAKKEKKRDEGEDEFESLIASWRSFVEKNDSGFRKACKKLASKQKDSLEAAKQVLSHVLTLDSDYEGTERFASMLKRVIRRAQKTGDSKPLSDFMEKVTSAVRPKTDSPIFLDEHDKPLPRKSARKRWRRAGRIHQLFESAYRFIQQQQYENGYSPQDIRNRIGKIRGEVYQAWLRTAPGLDDQDAGTIWESASDSVAHDLEDADNEATAIGGPENSAGTTFQMGRAASYFADFFSPGKLSGARNAKSMMVVVGDLIEHYAPRKNPLDLTRGDVRRYCSEFAPDVDAGRLYRKVCEVVGKGIPQRAQEEEQ